MAAILADILIQLKNLLVNTPRVIYWLQSYFGPLITDFTNLMSYAIHTKNYTYIEWQDLERGYKVVNRELYALTKGTIENKNISLDLEYSAKVTEFSKKINHKFKQYRSKAKKYKYQYST